jgi:hypothetical protein
MNPVDPGNPPIPPHRDDLEPRFKTAVRQQIEQP